MLTCRSHSRLLPIPSPLIPPALEKACEPIGCFAWRPWMFALALWNLANISLCRWNGLTGLTKLHLNLQTKRKRREERERQNNRILPNLYCHVVWWKVTKKKDLEMNETSWVCFSWQLFSTQIFILTAKTCLLNRDKWSWYKNGCKNYHSKNH